MTEKNRKMLPAEDKITVAILEDNATLVKGMTAELDKLDILVCFVSDNVDQFLEKLQTDGPQIAIVDLRIWKEFDAGFIVITRAQTLAPDTQFIIYTAYDLIEKFHTGINLGIRAFVSKNIYEKPLDEVVRIVARGGTYYGDLLEKYLDKIRENSVHLDFEEEQNGSHVGGLSRKEMEVLELLDQGMTSLEIASKLFVTVNTVKAHTKNIRGKLGVKSTSEAIRMYRLRQKDQQSSG